MPQKIKVFIDTFYYQAALSGIRTYINELVLGAKNSKNNNIEYRDTPTNDKGTHLVNITRSKEYYEESLKLLNTYETYYYKIHLSIRKLVDQKQKQNHKHLFQTIKNPIVTVGDSIGIVNLNDFTTFKIPPEYVICDELFSNCDSINTRCDRILSDSLDSSNPKKQTAPVTSIFYKVYKHFMETSEYHLGTNKLTGGAADTSLLMLRTNISDNLMRSFLNKTFS